MKDLLLKQIQFEFWANQALLENLKKANPLNPRALLLFSHLLSASSMWLSRLNNEALTTTLFQERTVEECQILLEKLSEGWRNYFEIFNIEDIERLIEFTSPIDGIKRRIMSNDAIMHVVHHSSYHRGQIIVLLKGSIETLPLITYMPFASKQIEV